VSAASHRPLRVGMIGPGLDVPGGMTAVHRTWLSADAMAGVEVDYFETMGHWAERGGLAGQAARLGRNLSCQARFLGALASGYRPDLWHIHIADRHSFYRKLVYFEEARRTGAPVVVHIHGAVFEEFHDQHPAHARAIAHMFERAALVLVLHGRIAARAREWTGGRAAVEVLYNPVVVRHFDPPAARPDDRDATVLMMGEIGERKGAFDLAAVIPEVLAACPGTRFRFGGNGETDRLRELLAQSGVASQATVLGWVAGEDKLREFRAADVYCLPSYNENLPVSVLEAMAARLPVVSTDIAGTPEEVVEGETGFLIRPGDRAALAARLVQLIRSPALRRTMGEAGRARVDACFENEVVVDRLRTLWEGAISAFR
jgi:glycosyltransferase involved in cell wall biosynthesis